ncbi:MAG: hypothetical protein AB7I38_18055 [Dehalococcoidia bacterium]
MMNHTDRIAKAIQDLPVLLRTIGVTPPKSIAEGIRLAKLTPSPSTGVQEARKKLAEATNQADYDQAARALARARAVETEMQDSRFLADLQSARARFLVDGVAPHVDPLFDKVCEAFNRSDIAGKYSAAVAGLPDLRQYNAGNLPVEVAQAVADARSVRPTMDACISAYNALCTISGEDTCGAATVENALTYIYRLGVINDAARAESVKMFAWMLDHGADQVREYIGLGTYAALPLNSVPLALTTPDGGEDRREEHYVWYTKEQLAEMNETG